MYCKNCGAKLYENSKFCTSCGAEAGSTFSAMPPPPEFSPASAKASLQEASDGAPSLISEEAAEKAAKDATSEDLPGKISWRFAVPIFQGVVLKQLGLAIGIPFGLLIIFLLATSGGEPYGLYAAGLIVALLVLTVLFLKIFYRGKYEAEFVLDDKGALFQTEARQAKKTAW